MFTGLLKRANWEPPTVLYNGSMEATDGWADFDPQGGSAVPLTNERSTEFIYEGSYSRKIVTDSVPAENGIISNTFDVEGGTFPYPVYRLSFWAYAEAIISIQAGFIEGDGGSFGSNGFSIPADVWTYKYVDWQSFEEGSLAQIWFANNTQYTEMTFWIDYVKFQRIS